MILNDTSIAFLQITQAQLLKNDVLFIADIVNFLKILVSLAKHLIIIRQWTIKFTGFVVLTVNQQLVFIAFFLALLMG